MDRFKRYFRKSLVFWKTRNCFVHVLFGEWSGIISSISHFVFPCRITDEVKSLIEECTAAMKGNKPSDTIQGFQVSVNMVNISSFFRFLMRYSHHSNSKPTKNNGNLVWILLCPFYHKGWFFQTPHLFQQKPTNSQTLSHSCPISWIFLFLFVLGVKEAQKLFSTNFVSLPLTSQMAAHGNTWMTRKYSKWFKIILQTIAHRCGEPSQNNTQQITPNSKNHKHKTQEHNNVQHK